MPSTRSANSAKATKAKNSGVAAHGAKASTAAKASSNKGRRKLTPPPDVSMAALMTYNMVRDKIEAQQKAAKKAQDEAIRARNQELLEADSGGSDEEASTRTRKRKRASEQQELSDSDAELAEGLTSVRATALSRRQQENEDKEDELQAEDQEEEETHSRAQEDEEEGLHADLQGIDVDDADVDMDLGSGEGDLSNEIAVETGSVGKSGSKSSSKSKTLQRAKTPTASTNTSKVVEKDFTPRTLRLALAAKSHIRTRTIYDEPFPRNNKIARINFAWKTLKESVTASDDLELRHAYKRAMKDTVVKSKLTKFTLYGRTGLISSIISKARNKVRAFYGLSGDPDVIRRDVEWLLKDSHFVYGGINLKERTVDQMKPFGCQLIVDIIEAQWFPSTSRSKLDLETTNRIYERRDLPLNVLLLSVTAIEHALKEWSSNGRKACQITFSEDTAKQSYERHLSHWKFFESQMKAWPAWFKKTTLGQILANHSNFDINAGENDFAGLDFAALDTMAGYESELEVADEEAAGRERGHQLEAVREHGQSEGQEEGSDAEEPDCQAEAPPRCQRTPRVSSTPSGRAGDAYESTD